MGEFYSTTDFYFSAALMALGFTLFGVDRVSSPFKFQFAVDDDRAEELLLEYINGGMEVPAIEYSRKIKDLKRVIYS